MRGRGDGTFRPQQTFTTAERTAFGAVGVGDFDEDGRPDLALAGGTDRGLDVFLGNGDGTFRFHDRFDSWRQSPDIVVEDIDGDDNLDVVVAALSSGENGVSVLFGNGDGSFQGPVNLFTGQSPVALEIVDFASPLEVPGGGTALGPPDGKLDIVVANSGFVMAVQTVGGPEAVVLPGVFETNESGELVLFGKPHRLAEAEFPIDVDAGDFDNDGLADIAVADRDGILVVFGEPPVIVPNDTPQTARDLGTVVHLVDQTQTIVPGRENAYYTLTVP
ncbi:MAG: FG-GAP repeat domain-containing protein, partial [Planctomycetota bacterium]